MITFYFQGASGSTDAWWSTDWQVTQNKCTVMSSRTENQSFRRSQNSNRHPKGSPSPNLNHCTHRGPWQLHFTHSFPFGEMRPKQFSQVRKLPRPDAQSRGISAVIATKGPGQFSCHIQTEGYFWRNADATALLYFTLSTPPRKTVSVTRRNCTCSDWCVMATIKCPTEGNNSGD